MIYITVEIQRVYSHGTDGMAKVEKYLNTIEDGAQWNKFLKYLPYQNYLNDRLKVVEVKEKTKEGFNVIDSEKWSQELKKVVNKMTIPEKTLDEKYLEEKQKNIDLLERLEAIEAKLNPPVKQELEVDKLIKYSEDTIESLRKKYSEKFEGKKPFHGWDIETLKKKIEG